MNRCHAVEPSPALLARHEQTRQVQTVAHLTTELAYLHALNRPQHARVLKDFTHRENWPSLFWIIRGVVLDCAVHRLLLLRLR